MLLNNCPKLTHLSLTGVQAFLLEELLTFCREAPPEFNDHQRDVFCVFSGTGVGRLRDYLNQEKARAMAGDGSTTPSLIGDGDRDGDGGIDIDVDTDNLDSDGSNTPVLNVDVHSHHRAGMTPVIPMPGPSSGLLFSSQQVGPGHQMAWQSHHHGGGMGSVLLSSSAPASTGSGMWGYHSSAPHPHPQPTGPPAGAQHVTGMMGAAALDDVDEGDEVFDGSETMGD